MWVIKNCYIMDPGSRREGLGDIVIEGKKIKNIIFYSVTPDGYEKTCSGRPERVLDAGGAAAAPGLVDIHTHFRDPGFTYKEDILTVAAAGIRGGYTTLIGMANTSPVVDTPDTVKYILEKGRETGINILTCAAITKGLEGRELTDMETLKEAGAVGFTDDGKPLMDEVIAIRAMRKAAELGVPLSFHEEDPAYISEAGINGSLQEDPDGDLKENQNIGQNKDLNKDEAMTAAGKMGLRGADPRAETSMIQRDIALAIETGAVIDIQHISTAEGVEMAGDVRRAGYTNIHAEATPHHFTLTQDAVEEYGTLAKMNPPLRSREDRDAIRRGLAEGVIDIIATDHAPHSKEEKDRDFTKAPSGITGLETALSLGITELVESGEMSLMELIDRFTLAPSKLYGLDAGRLAEGGPADIVLFDPSEEYTVEGFASKSGNSPFLGWRLKGVVKQVICAGKMLTMPDIRR